MGFYRIFHHLLPTQSHNWLSELDNPGCYLRARFLDFSKVFDRIDHTIVIAHLHDDVTRAKNSGSCSQIRVMF